MNTEEDQMHLLLSVLVVIGTVLVTTVLVILAWLPGARARARSHASARTIAIMGWCSLVIWPLWPVAYLWSRSRRYHRPARAVMRVRVSPPRIRGIGDAGAPDIGAPEIGAREIGARETVAAAPTSSVGASRAAAEADELDPHIVGTTA